MSATKLGKGALNSVEVTPFTVRQAQYEHKVSLSRYTGRGMYERTRNKPYTSPCENRLSIMNHHTTQLGVNDFT